MWFASTLTASRYVPRTVHSSEFLDAKPARQIFDSEYCRAPEPSLTVSCSLMPPDSKDSTSWHLYAESLKNVYQLSFLDPVFAA